MTTRCINPNHPSWDQQTEEIWVKCIRALRTSSMICVPCPECKKERHVTVGENIMRFFEMEMRKRKERKNE